ncbi:transposase domain-containing protein [Shewanella baltica]|uniref:transposase domain-containing protein n=1 Tax=Shewanella baltica TaxID=62322 RepID=UPI0030D56132
MWITAKELIGLPGIPTTSHKIRAMLDRLSDDSRKQKRQGTKAFEYHISILPVAVQTALYKRDGKIKVGDHVLTLPKKKAQSDGYCRDALWGRWNKTNHAAKDKAQEAMLTVKAVFALKRNGIKLMDAYESVCDEYDVALSTLRRHCAMVKGIDEADWAPALLPKHFEVSQAKKKNQFAFVSPEAWEMFKADYLRLEQPTMTVCYQRLLDKAVDTNWEIPSLKSLSRRMAHEIPAQQLVLLREGQHALHQLYPPQVRSVEGLHALEWINGDGYQHNVFVKWFNGEETRPKTWFWQDIYSRKIIGWRCDISENTDSIRLSLMDVCEKYGVPKEITIDNTRAAANKWMTGGVANRYRFKVKEDDPLGIIPMLGIKLHWSSVILGKGHGQAKPIERAFGVGGLEEYIDKHPACHGAYTGANPMAKPDNYGSKLIDAEDFLQVITKGVEMYNAKINRNTEICKGFMSFDQAFDVSYQQAEIRKATSAQLQLMMLQAEAVTVSKSGYIELDAGGSLKGRKNRYFNEVMMNYVGQKLVARFDPLKLHDALEIYALNGVHICTAECLEKVAFGDTQAARETKRKRTQFTKANKIAAAAKISIDSLELAAMMRPVAEEVIPETKVVMMMRPASIGNTATALSYQSEHETEHQAECAANFSQSIAYLRELKSKNRL